MRSSIGSDHSLRLTILSSVVLAGVAFGQSAPILVVGNASNPFATYYTQILKTEGINASEYADLNSVTAATLATRDVVILGETALSTDQVSLFSTWVNGGGNLIAMRPDKQLAGLLGLTDMGTTQANGYIGVDISRAPGMGIVGQTMQFHGTSDRYALNGATSVATLFSNATTALGTSPAVTWRSVGASGGKAAAFTYDLARSIVYTRQGNPAWAGTERDGTAPIRSDDMFFGGTQPDWVDRTKIAIPQADEQQRLLANLIEFLNLSRKPLPRFWYFPFGKKAALVMTGDNHALGGIPGRFDAFVAASTAGCVVANWECIRGTTYIYPNTPITSAQAQAYNSQGFEFGVHVNTNCANFTPATLPAFFTTQLKQFRTLFPTLPSPTSNRTHCIAFSDWSTEPKVELANGMRLDLNYYYWPGPWVNNTPGYMTGSGMPQRFADLDGTVIDTYQSETQMNDEASQVYPFTVDTLLDRAIGPEGYYSFFTANLHTDSSTGQSQTWAMNIVNSAKARGVPVITSRQFLTWIDARNDSGFTNLAWNGNTLTFTVTQTANANGLQVMLPKSAPSGSVAFITRGGVNVPFTAQTIKGITYVVFTSATGNYAVSYTALPNGISVSPASANLGLNATQNLTATITGLSDKSVTWSMNPSFGTLTPTGVGTAVYTSPAAATGTTVVTITATSNGDSSLTATSTISVTPPGPGCPCTIWTPSVLPAVPADPGDGSALEIGVKFRASQTGFIKGIRFYKGTGNNGTHIGNLWSSTGVNLGTATFLNETASGWQQVDFATPVAIAANTTYVASYYAPVGHYAVTTTYFAGATVSGPLTALADGTDGGNGLYKYGVGGGFPNNSFKSSNYWVDVVFVTPLGNSAPVAVANSYTAIQNQPLTVAAPGVLGNDTDANNDPLTAIKVTNPTNGTVTLNSNGSFTYTPTTGFFGTDSFTYKANDGTADSNAVTVTITVNPVPTATGESYTVTQGLVLTVAAPGVLSNDNSPGGLPLTAIKVSDPANGTVTLSGNGSFTYAPNPAFSGINTFTYKANNGTLDSNVATVTISVLAAPVAAGDIYAASVNVPLTVAAPGVLSNDSGGILTAIKLSDPANGTVALNSNGSFTYTPNAGFVGTNSFTYKANNGTTDSNVATVTINVNAAPVAVADIFTGNSGQPLTIAAPGLLSNDTTSTGVLTALKVTDPANGTVTVLPTGGFTYTPNPGFVGTDSFTYKANNGLADSNTVTVTLCACTIWASTVVPAVPEETGDSNALEIGVKFRASQAGYIKGIRFYKGTGNTGTHIGNLWSSAGGNLASATFTSETATGWQQVNFATPVAIAANTTYVASYYAPVGHYAVNTGYFTGATVNGPLTALANGTGGGNGVYKYGVGGGFPNKTWNSSNYWVDVVFSTVP